MQILPETVLYQDNGLYKHYLSKFKDIDLWVYQLDEDYAPGEVRFFDNYQEAKKWFDLYTKSH